MRPWALVISTSGRVAMKPRRASSKSCVSAKGSASSTAWFDARVKDVASWGPWAGLAIELTSTSAIDHMGEMHGDTNRDDRRCRGELEDRESTRLDSSA